MIDKVDYTHLIFREPKCV